MLSNLLMWTRDWLWICRLERFWAERIETSMRNGAQPMIRPDGEKKAYVRLTPDFDALDVANKGIQMT
uniref:Uncharacterized protein n=1 Tax=Eptatretus burgeri TaxID=7764 RepID=A0A8C4QMM5_EPTBU